MKKIIFGTASIIRGDFHKQTIGKFYQIYSELLKNYDIYHIINIDQPKNLKNYFTFYETIFLFNQIIPDFVKKIYITPSIPSFTGAFKNIVKKADEIIDEDSIFWWLEDDWEPKNNYNFIELIQNYWNLENCSFTFSTNAPFGSFRGGPLMGYSYFKNYFCIPDKMNDTCDPEKQISRFLRNNKEIIQVISISNDQNIHNLHLYYYSRKNIKCEIFVSNNGKLFQYDDNKFTEIGVEILNNKKIKYFAISPHLFSDEKFGKKFLDKYLLNKWISKEDNATYINPSFLNAYLGNWKNLPIDNLRLSPTITCNKGFFSCITYILQCLPYLDENYSEKVNIKYYSHNYGNYPNFEVFGGAIKLAYFPTISNKVSENLQCLAGLSKKICDNIFKDNFKLAKQYFDKYFVISSDIWDKVNNFSNNFANVLGVHFRGTDKNRVKWVTHCSSAKFIAVIKDNISKNNYDRIFVTSDEAQFIEELGKSVNLPIIHYDKINSSTPIHLDRLAVITEIIEKIKSASFDEKIALEYKLKTEAQYNQQLLEDAIINCLILSKCKVVIKTHSQLSAYAKVFNPELEIYRVNESSTKYWPESYIPNYSTISKLK
jgi:hypothetical protein